MATIDKDFLKLGVRVVKCVECERVVEGKWIAQDETFTKFMCSQCGSKNHAGYENFCPNCGADMRRKKVKE